MTSKRKLTMLQGQIEGMGRTEECLVMAMKVSIEGADLYEFARAGICRTSSDLPDGLYTVIFEGRQDQVKLTNGRWHLDECAS